MTDSRAWKQRYENAIIESDQTRLEQMVRECEAAIYERLHEINGDWRDAGERVEIATAIAALLDLKVRKLGWPDPRDRNDSENKSSTATHPEDLAHLE